MKNNLVGNKSLFAVEYMIEKYKPYLMGKIRLWINNYCIGSYEEDQMLLSVINQMDYIINVDKESNDFKNINKDSIFEIISENNDGYLINLGEGFDDFLLYRYFLNENIYFIWKLLENPFFNYINYSTELKYAIVESSYISNIIKNLKEELKIKNYK